MTKRVEGAIVFDDEGRAVMLVKETTGIAVETEDGVVVAQQTAVHGVVLGVRNQQHSLPAIEGPRSTPTVTEPTHDDDDDDDDDKGCCRGCSCCCVLKWTLLTIFCLPCLPLFCIIYCCCADE